MRPNPILLLAGVAATALCTHTLVFDEGLPSVRRLTAEVERVEDKSARLEAENVRLEREIELLETPGPYLEKVVRDELGYVKEGELVFRFEGDEPSADQGAPQGASAEEH